MVMKYFRTGVLQDAYVHHHGVICGEDMTPKQARLAAYDAWKGRRSDVVLTEAYTTAYDDADMIGVEDVEELTKEEYEALLAPNTADPVQIDAPAVVSDHMTSEGYSEKTLLDLMIRFAQERGLAQDLNNFLTKAAKETKG